NHEFDKGPAELLRQSRRARFRFLAANVIDKATLRPLFPAYALRTFAGQRIAVIGMTLAATPSLVTPSGVAGLEFRDEADTVNALLPEIRRRKAAAVVLLIHQGGEAEGGANACGNFMGPLADIVKRLADDVTLVVSGHTHRAYVCELPNSVGRPVLVTSAAAYGRIVTRIDLTIETTARKVIGVRAENLLVSRTGEAAPEIARLTSAYNARAAKTGSRVVGTIAADFTRVLSASGESSLGRLVADAQLAATRAAGKGGAVVAFMNGSGIRTDLLYGSSGGVVTYADAFAVQPFGNNLVVKTMTGEQIYALLEEPWKSARPRLLQVSAGFSYMYRASPARGEVHVCPGSATLGGVPLEQDARYRVAMNSFLASGGDGFSEFARGTDALGGDIDVDALASYLGAHGAVAPDTRERILQVASCDAR
ncbi:MAG: bifunctional metallophosphatase/5'-nucleotidase, partial [Betaproteobacteria bacterium]|nr:bifunctional metallophosphatase/5'-nucleotidase [Betaproteobacteria bacterium]